MRSPCVQRSSAESVVFPAQLLLLHSSLVCIVLILTIRRGNGSRNSALQLYRVCGW